jgi:hypothetical protein
MASRAISLMICSLGENPPLLCNSGKPRARHAVSSRRRKMATAFRLVKIEKSIQFFHGTGRYLANVGRGEIMPIPRDTVVDLYRYILGREPESDAVAESMAEQFASTAEARLATLRSEEFANQNELRGEGGSPLERSCVPALGFRPPDGQKALSNPNMIADGLLERVLGIAGASPLQRSIPAHARRFAEATGRLAKTDRLDAAMLARMGAMLELQTRPPRSETCLNSRSSTLLAKP